MVDIIDKCTFVMLSLIVYKDCLKSKRFYLTKFNTIKADLSNVVKKLNKKNG